jgi:hypothetical protein
MVLNILIFTFCNHQVGYAKLKRLCSDIYYISPVIGKPLSWCRLWNTRVSIILSAVEGKNI